MLASICFARALNAPVYGASSTTSPVSASRVEPAPRERLSELRVGHHRRVPDPVDRLQAVADADRVQPAPGAGSEHSGVDLEMQVPVWVAGPGGEMAYDGRLDLLDRHLHLPIPRPDACRRVGASHPMISSAAAIWAASYASAISGCSAAASDQVFGPLTVTSTNRTPFSSFRSLPFVSRCRRRIRRPIARRSRRPCRLGARRRPGLPRSAWRRRCLRRGSSRQLGSDRPRRSGAQRRRRRGRSSCRRASKHLPHQPSTTVKPQVSGHISARPATKLRSMRAAWKG